MLDPPSVLITILVGCGARIAGAAAPAAASPHHNPLLLLVGVAEAVVGVAELPMPRMEEVMNLIGTTFLRGKLE